MDKKYELKVVADAIPCLASSSSRSLSRCRPWSCRCRRRPPSCPRQWCPRCRGRPPRWPPGRARGSSGCAPASPRACRAYQACRACRACWAYLACCRHLHLRLHLAYLVCLVCWAKHEDSIQRPCSWFQAMLRQHL